MTGCQLTGWGAVTAAGVGNAALLETLSSGRPAARTVTGLYPDVPLPVSEAFACVDFDVRALLGRKGTSFLDRATALAVVACGLALADSGLRVDETNRERIGVVLGTTNGSFRSSSDYSRETLTQERPYLVNPVLFPNTVMNCATGQAAIRYGLQGVNCTVASGQTAYLGALRYAVNVLVRGYADAMLVGAVEEFTPHTAWAHHRLGRPGLPGEAAVVFVLERADARDSGRPALASVASVGCGFHPAGPAGLGAALARRVAAALDQAGVPPAEVGAVAVEGDAAVERSIVDLCGGTPIRLRALLGDCGAANGALHQVAALAGGWPNTVLAGWTPEGGLAAAVLTGAGPCRS